MARAILFAAAAVGATALLAASPTLAAEPFNGPYVGIQGGWQQDSDRLSTTTGATTVTTRGKKSGFEYGAQLGLDGRMNDQFVIGAEAFVNGSTGTVRLPGAGEVKAGRSFGLLARAGLLAAPETLVYGIGGWENGRFNYHRGGGEVAKNANGWSLGAGLEQMVGENLSARIEYRYTRFGEFGSNDLDALAGANSKLKATRNRVLVGVNYRF